MIATIGNFFRDRDQPQLSAEDEEIVQRFHDLYYRRWQAGADTINLSWFGYQLYKCPLDLWIYQELLVRTKPDVIIETGTCCGGSALFLAMMLDHIGHGRVVTIDIDGAPIRPQHPRISYITGSSTDASVIADVKQRVGEGRAMAILDANHYADFVYDELVAYSPLVKIGDYLIVEDTNADTIPSAPEYRDGPMKALNRFLAETDEFAIDHRCERFMLTLNPRGYLKRIKGSG
jgi:cephalosporin hydroxylase